MQEILLIVRLRQVIPTLSWKGIDGAAHSAPNLGTVIDLTELRKYAPIIPNEVAYEPWKMLYGLLRI